MTFCGLLNVSLLQMAPLGDRLLVKPEEEQKVYATPLAAATALLDASIAVAGQARHTSRRPIAVVLLQC